MSFTSLTFVAFVALVAAIYYMPFMARYQVTFLAMASFAFYTFHGVSLIVDRAREARDGRQETRSLRRELLETTFYLNFFPQLIAGPISRAHFFMPQIGPKQPVDVDVEAVCQNLILGYF